MWITDVLAKIAGRYDKRAMIAVNLASGSTS
jgi:hypothetical protein